MRQGKEIWVVGGDLRQGALAKLLAEDGHKVHTYGLEGWEQSRGKKELGQMGQGACVILPLPAMTQEGMLHAPLAPRPIPMEEVLERLSPGQFVCAGMVTPPLRAMAEGRGLTLHDYFAREELAVLNAVPTAEGAIQTAMEELPITLQGARVLILGFGRLGHALLPRLRGLGAQVWVAARSHAQRAMAESLGAWGEGLVELPDWLHRFDLVFNTIPARLLGVEELSALREGALVIDLASRPGGVDLGAAATLGVRVIWALSLPGKVAPLSAGGYIRDTVYHMMEEMGV